MLKTFIERPVLSTVISILIVVLGVIGLATLPIEQYPDIAPPTVRIDTQYSGANAEVVMKSVIIPIEEAVNGVENMTYMTSSASNSGSAEITVFFNRETNPDIAAVNVQNLVSKALPLLPSEVTKVGVTVQKQQPSTIMMISLSANNGVYTEKDIQNYANIYIIPTIKRVHGVGNAMVYGAKDYAMRIWFNPDKMNNYGITPMEAIAALSDQNIEAAPGQLGERAHQAFEYTLKYTGRLTQPEQFSDIIIRSHNGEVLKLGDIAEVEQDALSYSVTSALNGNPSVAIAISQTAGSNAQELISTIKERIDELSASFPTGYQVTYVMDASEFLNVSISKVITTLIEAFFLVFLVVFVFLQDFRSTLIPAIAVPVAIIGTFFFLTLFGFSINLLTLFALVLAIGIVVDDAIVVVEAVHARLEAGEKDPKQAAIDAMKEIAPAIVSITLVMSSVFLPVSFMGGTSGVFYRQFGLTLAFAIIISAVNALTLSPALCAIFLKPHESGEEEQKKGFLKRFYFYFNLYFDAGTQKYKKSLHFLGKKGHRWITIAIIAVSTVVLVVIMRMLPSGFVPQEDGGAVMGMVQLPPGTSLEKTDSLMTEVGRMLEGIEEVNHVLKIAGVNFMSGLGSSAGSFVVKMKPWNERSRTVQEINMEINKRLFANTSASFMFFPTPTLQGFGLSTGVEVQLQDKKGGDIMEFYLNVQEFLGAMTARPEVQIAMTTFNPFYPQKEIHADIPKIKAAGLTLSDIMTTLQAYIGSMYVSNYNQYGKQFRVMVQASPEFRAKQSDLHRLTVRTANGTMAPITEFINIKDVTGPQNLNRFNMYSSINATILPQKGYSTGDVIAIMKEVASETLMKDVTKGYDYEFSGMTREEASSANQTGIIFAICLVFVYLLLAALYESYLIPLSVIFSLPIGLAGVYIFLMIFGASSGIDNNIYVQISLIMLIGLLAKNAILIVEYAMQRRQAGMSIVEAAVNGAVARFRPILMTSFAFIFGLLPLMFASGAGATGNRSIGISAVGGMLIGTMIGVLVIPSLYIIFQTIQDKFTKKTIKSDKE